MYFQLPGKKASGPGGWAIQAKLQMYLWLGLTKHKKYFLRGLPKGYDCTAEIKNSEKLQTAPPLSIHYSGTLVSCCYSIRCTDK